MFDILSVINAIKSPCPIDGSKILDGAFKINSKTFSLSSLLVVKYCPKLCFFVIVGIFVFIILR